MKGACQLLYFASGLSEDDTVIKRPWLVVLDKTVRCPSPPPEMDPKIAYPKIAGKNVRVDAVAVALMIGSELFDKRSLRTYKLRGLRYVPLNPSAFDTLDNYYSHCVNPIPEQLQKTIEYCQITLDDLNQKFQKLSSILEVPLKGSTQVQFLGG